MKRQRAYQLIVVVALGLGLLTTYGLVHAGEVTLTWTAPTDGETCTPQGPIDDLIGYRIFRMVAELEQPTLETFTEYGLAPGDYRYTAVAYNPSGESRTSPSTTKTVADFVTTATPVFTAIKAADRFILLPVGNVPLGTACDMDNSVNGHYAVPRDLVTFNGTVNPYVVVAKCG